MVPALVKAGDDCLVKVRIDKGNLSGLARLQHILPFGLTAKPVETQGARFSMVDNLVKFIWDRLPADPSFEISYRILTDPNASGLQAVTGTFAFVENDTIQNVDVDSVYLNYSGDPAAEKKPEVERKILILNREAGEYRVELTVYRKEGQSAAQFVDLIPEGFTVTDVNSHGGRFLFNKRKAVFEWDELPTEASFQIGYTLLASEPHAQHPVINGFLVYGSVQNEPPIDPRTPVSEEMQAAISKSLKKETPSLQPVPRSTAPGDGVFYKIQISATRKSPVRNEEFIRKSFHVDGPVELSQHEGWNKYMIGSFETLRDAKDVRSRAVKDAPGAFVVAYYHGERIRVEDAIAMSKQKTNP